MSESVNSIAAAMARSQKPYLLRAIYEWLTAEQNAKPHIRVQLNHPGVVVPPHLRVREDIILNLSMSATSQLVMGNEVITFAARFNQKSFAVTVPVDAVTAIFDLETGGGMAFMYYEKAAEQAPTLPETPPEETKPKVSFLRVVK